MDSMIAIDDLTFSYPGRKPLFQGFTLRINHGEAWVITGPSGCGKSTLLYLLSGLLHPSSGKIRIAGMSILRPRPQTGLILQDHGLLPWATVRENASLGWKIRGFYGPDGKHSPSGKKVDQGTAMGRVNYWLQRLKIDHLYDKYPPQLSRGERQRAAIARTLSLEPDLLLMDEPFSALDPAIREDLQKAMIFFHRESVLTTALVTHDMEEALFMGTHILVLKEGTQGEARVIHNDSAGRDDYRDLPGFREKLETLRTMIGGRL